MRVLIFVFVFILTVSLSNYLLIRYLTKYAILKRLDTIHTESSLNISPTRTRLNLKIRNLLSKLIPFSMPNEEWVNSKIRSRFMTAGYYRESDALAFFGIKTSLTIGLPGLYILFHLLLGGHATLLNTFSIAIFLAALGYYGPNFWLARKSKSRSESIFNSLPNALDLMRICVSAGLGLDAAIERVGKELKIDSKPLAQEFSLLSLELRAGATREKALSNLADRTGVEDINTLVTMLIQSDKFGTSITDALQIYADGLREKRALLAQELAAKIPVKMTFPLIICIFPALMVVLIGPAIIMISKALAPMISNTQ